MRRESRCQRLYLVFIAVSAVAVAAILSACDIADGLIGVHDPFLPGFNQVPAPVVTPASTGIRVGETVDITASGSGAGAEYNWSIAAGGGSIDPTGATVTFAASDTPETVTISVYASLPGYQDSDSVETDIVVSDLPFLDAPTISFDEGTSTVFVNNTVNVSASGSGSGVTYNWSVTGSGSIGATGATVAYTAPASEESVTISVYASAEGYNDSQATQTAVTVKDNHFALLRLTDTSFNLNQTATIAWSSAALDSTHFDNSTPSQLQVLQDGDYFVALTIPMFDTSGAQRTAVRAQLYVNGGAVAGAVADSSYIRRGTVNEHDESSDHLAMLLDGLSAGDTIEVRLTQSGIAGVVTVSDQATLYAEYVDASRTVYAGTATATVAGTNFNQATASPLVWTTHVADSGFTPAGSAITLDSAGYYLVCANLPTAMTGPSTARFSIEMLVELDGTTVVGGRARQGYIRNQSGHDTASVHWSGLIQANAGQDLTISVRREQSMTTTTPGVDIGSNEATIFVERIDTGAFVYSGKAVDPETGSDWNSGSELNIDWNQGDDVIDAITYSHATTGTSDEITLQKAGDYLIIYNDALIHSGSDIRVNPRIQLRLDGSAVPGAQTKSHYIRNDATGNDRSSASLVFYLQGITAGQVLTVTTQQESVTGAVVAEDDALLAIIRKK